MRAVDDLDHAGLRRISRHSRYTICDTVRRHQPPGAFDGDIGRMLTGQKNKTSQRGD